MKTKKLFLAFGLLLLFAVVGNAQQVTSAEYFIDTDPGLGNGTAISFTTADSVSVNFNITLPALSNGFHNLFIRTKNNNGKWGLHEGRSFFVSPLTITSQIASAEYFIDTDPGLGNGTALSIGSLADSVSVMSSINLSALSNGFHNLFIRTKNTSGKWSLYEGRSFYVTPIMVSAQIASAEYFIDTDPGLGNGNALSTGSIADSVSVMSSINLTALSYGFHNLFIRTKNTDGKWSLYEGRSFYVSQPALSTLEATLVNAEYFIDADTGVGTGTLILPAFSPADSIDVIANLPLSAAVDTGSHYVCIRVQNQLGLWSLQECGSFYVSTSVSVNNVNNPYSINLSPNPSSGFFTLELSEFIKQDTQLEIYNSIGQKVYSTTITNTKTEIDLSKQAKGIYNIKLTSNNNSSTQKLIIQ